MPLYVWERPKGEEMVREYATTRRRPAPSDSTCSRGARTQLLKGRQTEAPRVSRGFLASPPDPGVGGTRARAPPVLRSPGLGPPPLPLSPSTHATNTIQTEGRERAGSQGGESREARPSGAERGFGWVPRAAARYFQCSMVWVWAAVAIAGS